MSMSDCISAEEQKTRDAAIKSDLEADRLMSEHHENRRTKIRERPRPTTPDTKKALNLRYFHRVMLNREYTEALREDIATARLVQSRPETKIKGSVIVKSVARKHGLRVADLKSHCRSKHIMPARFEACYEMRRLTLLSMPQIGKILGGRDHTTILHGIRQHAIRNGLPRLDGAG